MTFAEKYKYWEMLSDYDLETARAMIEAKRWLYVASICYSSVERLVKGLIVFGTRKEAPKSDNIIFLLNRLADNPSFAATETGQRFRLERGKYLDAIIDITYYHINDYPFSYQKIMDRFIEEDTAKEVYNKSLDVLSWLKTYAPAEEQTPA